VNQIPSIVLAGGRASPELAAQIGTPVRALGRFQGRPLIEIVVDALRAAQPAAPITVVGDVPDRACCKRVPDQGGFVANILAGLALHRDADWALFVSADLPFLTGEVIERFVSEALAASAGAQVVYPIVAVAACYARYPGIKRTTVRLREGEFTGGNVMLARPSFFLDRQALLADAYAARKRPVRLAAMLGAGTVARLLFSQLVSPRALSVEELERRVGRFVRADVRALISASPELATDLDRPSDFAAAERFAAPD